MKISKAFIKTSNWILATLLTLLGFSNCEPQVEYGVPNADYSVKGTVVDKVSSKPIKGIRVGFSSAPQIMLMYGVMPTPYRTYKADTTDIKGVYDLTQHFDIGEIPENATPVFVQDIDGAKNGLYRDTVILVNFENAVRTGKQKNWDKGTLTVKQNIELTPKKDSNE